MKPCAAMHPMIRIHPDTLTEEDQLLGEWFRCPRCDKVALIPKGKLRPEQVR